MDETIPIPVTTTRLMMYPHFEKMELQTIQMQIWQMQT